MSTVRMYPPANVPDLSIAGQLLQRDSDGTMSVDGRYVASLVTAGFTVAPDEVFSGDHTTFDGTKLAPGLCLFDSVLNKPIWRNINNTGWVDATGTVVP